MVWVSEIKLFDVKTKFIQLKTELPYKEYNYLIVKAKSFI